MRRDARRGECLHDSESLRGAERANFDRNSGLNLGKYHLYLFDRGAGDRLQYLKSMSLMRRAIVRPGARDPWSRNRRLFSSERTPTI